MMRFATDENFNGHMPSGLRKRLPDLDIVRVQDTEMYGSPDPELLEYSIYGFLMGQIKGSMKKLRV